MPETLLKKGLWHRCFPVNFAKFLRTLFLAEHLRWLLLSIPINEDNLQIPGYISVRAEHPSNTKRGGALLYVLLCYKSFLSIKLIDVNYLDICIIMNAVLN